MRTVAILLMSILTVAFLLSPVSAFGVAQQYRADKTVEIYPGESTTHYIEVQNPDDETILVNISVQGDFVTLQGQDAITVNIPAKQLRSQFPVDIIIPKNATPGELHKVTFSVMQVVPRQGMVAMSYRIHDDFYISVLAPPGFIDRLTGAISTGANSAKNAIISPLFIGALAVVAFIVLLSLLYFRSSAVAQKFTRKKKNHKTTLRARTLHELALALDAMTDAEYVKKMHAGEFSSWAKAHGHQNIAVELSSATTRQAAIHIILNHEQ